MSVTRARKGAGRKAGLSRLLRQVGESPRVLRLAGKSVAAYLRLVRWTSRLVMEPHPYTLFENDLPVILTMWHGQHLMLPFIRKKGHEIRVMISRHRDGEINAVAAESLGMGTVRASAARKPGRIIEKGAIRGFLEMKALLAQGTTVSMTADLSNVEARRVGLGLIMLARASGRPIVPAAFASSRRIDLATWDRTTINLPFSRATCIAGAPIYVPADADDAEMEAKRQEVEDSLNDVTERAYAFVDRRHA